MLPSNYLNLLPHEQESILRSLFKIIAVSKKYLIAVPEYDDGIDLVLIDENSYPFKTYLVQLKSRFSIDNKYMGRGYYIGFYNVGTWYFLDYDKFQEIVLGNFEYKHFLEQGKHNAPKMPRNLEKLLEEYKFEIE